MLCELLGLSFIVNLSMFIEARESEKEKEKEGRQETGLGVGSVWGG